MFPGFLCAEEIAGGKCVGSIHSASNRISPSHMNGGQNIWSDSEIVGDGASPHRGMRFIHFSAGYQLQGTVKRCKLHKVKCVFNFLCMAAYAPCDQ